MLVKGQIFGDRKAYDVAVAVYKGQELASPKTAYLVSSLACIYCILTAYLVMIPLGKIFF